VDRSRENGLRGGKKSAGRKKRVKRIFEEPTTSQGETRKQNISKRKGKGEDGGEGEAMARRERWEIGTERILWKSTRKRTQNRGPVGKWEGNRQSRGKKGRKYQLSTSEGGQLEARGGPMGNEKT